MDPASRRRVRGATKNTPRKARPSNLRESPPSPPLQRRTKTREPSEEVQDTEKFHALKTPGILAEEKRKGRLCYLLNWADDPDTGEAYEPTWEPVENATPAAIEEWKQRKAARVQLENTEAAIPDSPESPPIRTTTRKRRAEQEDSLLRVGSPVKRRREGSSGSQPPGRIGSEIPDTYEGEQISLRDGGSEPRLRIEVGVPPGFERDAYAQAAASQSSQIQSSESEKTGSLTAAQRRLRRLIWDEEIDIDVPDSEEQVGSSAFRVSGTSSTSIGVPASSGSERILEGLSNRIGLPATQPSIARHSSASVGDSLAEPQSFLSRESFRGTGSTLDQRQASIRQTSVQESNSTWKDSSGSQGLRLPSRQVETSSDPAFTQNRFYPSQSASSQSSEQFLTQVIPDSSPSLRSSQIGFSNTHKPLENSAFISSSERSSQKIRSQTRPQTIADDFLSQQSLPVIASASGLVGRKSKGDPLSPQGEYRSSGSQLSQLADNHETPHRTNSQRTSSGPELRSIVHSQTLQASQTSQARLANNSSGSKSSQDHSQSSHFPTPPFEDILPSTEQRSYDNPQSPQHQNTPPSSDPIGNSSPVRNLSSMEPSPRPEAFDAKAAIREKMAAKRAEIIKRQADRLSSSAPIQSPLLTGPSEEQTGLKFNPSGQMNGKEEDENVDEPLSSIPPASLVSQASTHLEVVPHTADEFLVPLPMVAMVRDIYSEVLRRNKTLISEAVKEHKEDFDEEQVKEIDSMLGNLHSLCDHQDTYEEEPLTQESEPISTRDRAKWAENCSTKCMFLAELLDAIKLQDAHLLIIVRPGKMMEILQAMLEYREMNYSIANGNIQGPDPTKSALRVTLHPAGSQKFLVEPASVVIVFDTPSKDASFLQELRLNAKRYPSGLAPLVSLVVTHTIEHLERCFNDNIGHVQGKIRLIKYLRQIGENFGHLEGPYASPADAAKAVAEYLDNGALAESWPLPPMPEIEQIDLSPASSEESKEGLYTDSKTEALNKPQSNPMQSSSKRQLANDLMDIDSPKRQRMTPVPGELNADMDISHISNSVVPQSSVLPFSSAMPSSSKTGSSTEAEQTAMLRRKVKDLERRLETSKACEAQYKRLMESFERRCNDLEESIENIQPKYQEALNDRAQFEYNAKQASDSEAVVRKRLERKEAELTKLEEKNATMAVELSAVQELLSNSAVPEVAEMTKMREEMSKLRAENEQLQKKLAGAEKQVEYMRSSYQSSSSSAAESASELEDLRAMNGELQKKADENSVRIHGLHRDTEIAHHLTTISRLKSDKENLEKEVEKKGEELTVVRASRRNNTRAMSGTPASPKVTGTLSPGPFRNKPYNPTSRGGSPNPSDFFGGNLDGSTRGPPQRWNNHRFQE